ncbi:hypothetical protein OSB04_024765 [Centaurea solstitialis]|uniref:Ubiquitin-like protease family profile domain-containing protein n=1 Tax=Centaurea solstitialis TaxID=347529 RepID=A0AA38SU97_9ASTR|nr:hypothetical protein OSB04_024765 [Centaurea solstitialis]
MKIRFRFPRVKSGERGVITSMDDFVGDDLAIYSHEGDCNVSGRNSVIQPPQMMNEAQEDQLSLDNEFELQPLLTNKHSSSELAADRVMHVGETKLKYIKGKGKTCLRDLKTRTSPKTLFDTIKGLKDGQRVAIREMGLESLLDMTVDGIPLKMGFYVVDRLDTCNMVIKMEEENIPITVQSIHKILGLPTGGLDLASVDPTRISDELSASWKSQSTKYRMRPTDVMKIIHSSEDAGTTFKLNFLVIMVNSLAECSPVGCCNVNFLSRIHGVDMIPKIDWRKYVYDCIERSKENWKWDSDLSFYTGPLTYLALLYVDSTSCHTPRVPYQNPPLRTWSLKLLRCRQQIELDAGGFGIVRLRGKGTYASTSKQCGGSSVPDEARDSSYIPPVKEAWLGMLDTKIAELESLRIDTYSKLGKAMEIFPGETCFKQIEEKLDHSNTPSTPKVSNDCMALVETDVVSPLSQFWGSPTLHAVVDKYSNQKIVHDEQLDRVTTKETRLNKTDVESSSFGKGKCTTGDITGDNKTMREVLVVREKDSTCATRTVTGDELDVPKFDLGISPSQKRVHFEVGSERLCNRFETKGRCSTRNIRLGEKLKSPYVQRAVTFVVDADETTAQNWLLKGVGGCLDIVFETHGTEIIKHREMQTFATKSNVSRQIIDGLSVVLNHEEQLRSNDSPRRYFLSTAVGIDPAVTNHHIIMGERYAGFRSCISKFANHDQEIINMRNIDLVFFPFVDNIGFYVVVFNLKQPSIMIIDSQDRDGISTDLYNLKTYELQDLMTMHLRQVGHRAASAFEEIQQETLKMRWQGRGNDVDFGVILMRIMETYMGGDVRTWDNGLYKERTKQKRQLKNLRTKYISKILFSKVNNKKEAVVAEVQRFISQEASWIRKGKRGRG